MLSCVTHHMLFRQAVLDGIRAGTITLAFRRWRRPTVRSGGTLLTAIGQLAITSVTGVAIDEISAADAQRAGYPSRDALLSDLDARAEGDVYRIEIGAVRADPRVALRESPPEEGETASIARRLATLDAAAAGGPWTRRVLEIIAANSSVRAGDLCARVGQEQVVFKRNVRKLKALGLTESLGIGYRLSPRGAAVLDRLRGAAGTTRRS